MPIKRRLTGDGSPYRSRAFVRFMRSAGAPQSQAEGNCRHQPDHSVALQGVVRQAEEDPDPVLEFEEKGDDWLLDIEPGPRTLIAAVDVAVDGPLAAKTRQALIEARLLETSMNPQTVKGIDWTGTLEAQKVRAGKANPMMLEKEDIATMVPTP